MHDQPHHSFGELFKQLGLPADPQGIQDFIAAHRPLPDTVRLADAPFWNANQSAFLREEIQRDADWAELVDQLNVALRQA
jgi:hypothetical protein